MGKTRRIAVFEVKYEGTGTDGVCIYDHIDENTVSANGATPAIIDAEHLWPLIRIFVQFSREVHGGSVKRLVFRSPQAYAVQTYRFEPSQHPPRAAPVIVVHVAHDPLFVVAVTERLSAEAASATALLTVPDDTQKRVLTISQFCTSILNFLKSQVESTSTGVTTPNQPGISKASNVSLEDFINADRAPSNAVNEMPRSTELAGGESEARAPQANQSSPAIEPSRLSEFIANSQNLLDT